MSGSSAATDVQLSERMRGAQAKARVLREALPWLTRWAGRTVVVKYGGNTLAAGGEAAAASGPPASAAADDPLDSAFAADVALLRRAGLRVVVVHGGGPQISALGERLGLRATFVDGKRVTDAATLDVVKMALLGIVNPYLVRLISAAGATAVGLSGTDGGLVVARPGVPELGLVGEVESVDPRTVQAVLDRGAVPVIASVCRDADGQERNVNADTMAGAVAQALEADKLIYLTNVPGLYEDFGTPDSTLLSEVSVTRLTELLAVGALHTGMVPKIASIVDAMKGGVAQAHLLDGRVEHALLLEVFTDEGIGTMVTAS